MCNIDCVPKAWSLALKDYAWLDEFCKCNSISEDDFGWLMSFCTRNSLDFKSFYDLVNFYDFHKNECCMNLEKRKNEFKDSLKLRFDDTKFIVSSRVKSFFRVVKKIDKKNNSGLDGLSWKDIVTSYDKFEYAINKYVKDFCGCRVIPVLGSSDFFIEGLNYTLKTISPQDFLLKLFIPATVIYEEYNNSILYSIKAFFDEEYKVCHYKDFLSTPKPNGYRSLQFVCFFDDTEKLEVQIRNFLHHIYAEYEHRRYEDKINFSEFIPFYLSCEICSSYFGNDKIRKFDFSKMAFMYFLCLSILTSDDMHFNEMNLEIENYVSEYIYNNGVIYCNYDCDNLYSFDCDNLYTFECDNSYCFDDVFIQNCVYIIKSVKENIIRDSQRFCTSIKNQIILEMNLLDDAYIIERIMSIINDVDNKKSRGLIYKISTKKN